MNGFLNILKPPGMTSNDVIVYIRRLLGEKKAGHAGTLDPGAAGVLPVCMGKATRLFDYLVDKEKEYIAEMTLGIETDTQDQYGTIIKRDEEMPDDNDVMDALSAQTGSILQKPPMFSAIKHQGRKLYDLAREGLDVDIQERKVTVHSIGILKKTARGSWLMNIKCSRGTYIRTICHDAGQRLGCGAHLSLLIRTSCGPFMIRDSFTLEQIKSLHESGDIGTALQPMDFALQQMPRLDLNQPGFAALRNGRPIRMDMVNGLSRLYYNDIIVGVGETLGGECRIKTFLLQV